MKNIADIIQDVCREAHVPMAEEVFGAEGLDAIFRVMEVVKSFYRHVDPERITGEVVFFQVVKSRLSALPRSPNRVPVDFASFANQQLGRMCFEVDESGACYVHSNPSSTSEDLAKDSIVYLFKADSEEFLAGSQRRKVPRLDSAARSQFSIPTFPDLREALLNYARENVRESTCLILRKVWFDSNRLFLVAGPEHIMRDSLKQYLTNRLGGEHDVWAEQNVNEKNPVDIRVQTRLSNNRLMLIEIKWLGDSADSAGNVTVRHRDARAKEGAIQLADYLDEQKQNAPGRVIQGFYVIVDARRKGLPKVAVKDGVITLADGRHYEAAEIDFDPNPHQSRNDFDPPYRMFACPKCS